ncbi:hypothetical protein M422DRAFT_253501 [Sphaerobolus stellatus SS14]|uniref:Uncharacterized protein n=1 Tax=Sphaerobolus stellatus (strain SS14) TaxID=990650 RepID=A0A0C9UJS4_SPHS4|nr:hypothetical protein M422DRAFT_253501 [Sphaerobolus stellatus SS14]
MPTIMELKEKSVLPILAHPRTPNMLFYCITNFSWDSMIWMSYLWRMPQSFASSLNLSGHSSLYYKEVGNLLQTEDYKLCAAEWLGGAVREPTESYDDMGPIGEDSH